LLTAENLKGVWATVLLPVNRDGSVDFHCLAEELDILCRTQVQGIYTNGTAAEFFNQSESEFDQIQVMAAEKCRKENIPFQIGASHMSPVICLERIKRTLSLKPDAYQIILPDWLPPTTEEQIDFLLRVAEIADGTPLVLYNPGHAKRVLLPKDYYALQQAVPELIGIKTAAGDKIWFNEMRKYQHGLAIFIQGHRLATGIKQQVAHGSYSNMACFNPFGAVRWYQLMLEDIEEALYIEEKIMLFLETCILPFSKNGYSDTALDKLLAFAGNWSNLTTRLKWPYKGVSTDEACKIRDTAKRMLPEILTKI